MARTNAQKATHQMQGTLKELFSRGYGTSRRKAKAAHNGVSPFIHSDKTMATYMQQVNRYGDWLAANHPEANYNTAASYAEEYIKGLRSQGLSAWTQTTARAAIAKATRTDLTHIEVDRRSTASITRGRTETTHAAAAAAKWGDDLAICECIGVRHGKEAPQVTPEHCNWKDGHIATISLIGKGGRPRDALVLEGKGRDILESRCKSASSQSQPLLGKMTGANVHGARAKYARGCYNYAMSNGYSSGRTYTTRGRYRASYDKRALDFVTLNLGHGPNRYETAVHNYLSYA